MQLVSALLDEMFMFSRGKSGCSVNEYMKIHILPKFVFNRIQLHFVFCRLINP
jgi:hypothetical protein